jgi:hypothetical protein
MHRLTLSLQLADFLAVVINVCSKLLVVSVLGVIIYHFMPFKVATAAINQLANVTDTSVIIIIIITTYYENLQNSTNKVQQYYEVQT